jgi:hypothetical protein
MHINNVFLSINLDALDSLAQGYTFKNRLSSYRKAEPALEQSFLLD